MLSQEQFLTKMLPHAREACRLLGAPEYPAAAVILAQWDVESGREAPQWVGHNNYAGITHGSPDKGFRQYPSPAEFVTDYVHVLLTTYGGSAYRPLVEALRSSTDPQELVEELANSPWDAGHYGQAEGLPRGELLRQRLPFYLEQLQPIPEVSSWAADSRLKLMELGVTDGTRPKDTLTREEGWTMLARLRQSILAELLAAVGGGQGGS